MLGEAAWPVARERPESIISSRSFVRLDSRVSTLSRAACRGIALFESVNEYLVRLRKSNESGEMDYAAKSCRSSRWIDHTPDAAEGRDVVKYCKQCQQVAGREH